jgi:Raf kinase inhibitor-like YbhB/YbcL family protein
MMKRFIYAIFAALVFCAALAAGESTKKGGGKMQVKVTSEAFDEGGMIPGKYTCDGQDVSPPLSWGSVPEGAKSIALISDDPDAPRGTWVHWVVFNLPPTLKGLPEGIPRKETLDDGGRQGVNDFGRFGYGGPCPPGGTHRYYFKIYILDTSLGLTGRVTKARLLEAMEGHILAEGRLMGRYKRR